MSISTGVGSIFPLGASQSTQFQRLDSLQERVERFLCYFTDTRFPLGPFGTRQSYVPLGALGTRQASIPLGTLGACQAYSPLGAVGTLIALYALRALFSLESSGSLRTGFALRPLRPVTAATTASPKQHHHTKDPIT
ncbi:hypothetical protein [Desulfoluna sp.]|uniref:hypothetical protein n=1 Tax=Desulfoluna sp. TaxID=2045199 RepID=UPI002634C916|nr:hypothetical protein [Desulfoluna sp.]